MKRPFGRGGPPVPVIGQGTWRMGGDVAGEAAALARGIELGLTHLDTAEMYGAAEDVVARVLQDRRREDLFVVSKVLPSNASRAGTIDACERSLRRIGTDHLDCYLLHWPGSHPLAETMGALEALVAQGKIRSLGVSNFDTDELKAAQAALSSERIACNQVFYDLSHRGVELELVPYCQAEGIAFVGYSPLGQGALPDPDGPGGRALAEVARARGVTAAAVILAFLTRAEGTFTIPKAARREHVEANARALDLELTPEELEEIDRAFPAPPRAGPLSMR